MVQTDGREYGWLIGECFSYALEEPHYTLRLVGVLSSRPKPTGPPPPPSSASPSFMGAPSLPGFRGTHYQTPRGMRTLHWDAGSLGK